MMAVTSVFNYYFICFYCFILYSYINAIYAMLGHVHRMDDGCIRKGLLYGKLTTGAMYVSAK